MFAWLKEFIKSFNPPKAQESLPDIAAIQKTAPLKSEIINNNADIIIELNHKIQQIFYTSIQ